MIADEKRYDMSELRLSYKKTSQEEFVGERTTVSKEKKSKTMNPSSSSKQMPAIKLEDPLFSKHKQLLKTLNSGKGHKFE